MTLVIRLTLTLYLKNAPYLPSRVGRFVVRPPSSFERDTCDGMERVAPRRFSKALARNGSRSG